MFQFHNGTINTKITGDGTVDASDSFNSTTVQLIPWPNHRKRPRQSFQFHNGTINTMKTEEVAAKIKYVSIPQRYN